LKNPEFILGFGLKPRFSLLWVYNIKVKDRVLLVMKLLLKIHLNSDKGNLCTNKSTRIFFVNGMDTKTGMDIVTSYKKHSAWREENWSNFSGNYTFINMKETER
jgi:hypothetical protein